MTILAQVGVGILIAGIVFILFRANHMLADAEQEGEHFVDEWALREERRILAMNRAALQAGTEEIQRGNPIIEEQKIADEAWMNEEAWMKKEESGIWEEEDLRAETGKNRLPESLQEKPQEMETGIVLTVRQRGFPPRRIAVRCIPFTIGRDQGNALCLDDLSVARHHAEIVKMQDEYHIVLCRTSHSLRVNGRMLEDAVLSDGTEIMMGSVLITATAGDSSWTGGYDNPHVAG